MPRGHSAKRLLVGVTVATTLAACGGSDSVTGPGGGATPRPTPYTIEGVVAPGKTVRLVGADLGAGATVTVDGKAVTPAVVGDGRLEIPMPSLACDVDGREVAIAVTPAGGRATTVKATLDASDGAMKPFAEGESRILTGAQMDCFRLVRGAGRYAITVANLAGDGSGERVNLGRFRVFADGSNASAAVAARLVAARASVANPVLDAHLRGVASAQIVGMASNAPLVGATPAWDMDAVLAPLATAGTGDRITMPKNTMLDPSGQYWCNVNPSSRPQWDLTVAAVSGRVAILVDNADPEAGTLLAAASKTELIQVAARVDSFALPAIRQVLGDGANYHPTANGRVFVMLADLPNGIGGYPGGMDNAHRQWCPGSLAINSVVIDSRSAQNGPWLTETVAHELAHVLDGSVPRTDGLPNGGRSGWMGEALAENVGETMLRLAAGGTGPVELEAATNQYGIANPWSRWLPTGARMQESAFSAPGHYTQGSKLLLFARERAGQGGVTAPHATGSTLYERLARMQTDGSWTVDQLGGLIGMSGADLIDQATLAIATDDQVSPEAARAQGLPQFASYDNSGAIDRADDVYVVRPKTSRDEGMAVGAGNAFTRYVETSAARGAAGAIDVADAVPIRVRLTRLR